MSQTEREGKIIEASLLKWISILTGNKTQFFQELVQGEFYLNLLAKISGFKLVKSLKPVNEQKQSKNNMVNTIFNTKIIGQSIIRFYQTFLLRDVSMMRINYVQLCMGSCQQSIKLFSLLMGMLDQQSEQYQEMMSSIESLESSEDRYIVKALLENSRQIGQNIEGFEKDNGISWRKQMISKLEIYQDKIEALEEEIKELIFQLNEEKCKSSTHLTEIKQLKGQKIKLIQKAEVLEVLNSRLQTENSSLNFQISSLTKKLQSSKRQYQIVNEQLKEKLSCHNTLLGEYSCLSQNLSALKKINQQLQLQLQQKSNYIKGQCLKYSLIKQTCVQLKQKLKGLQTKYHTLQQQNQSLKSNYQNRLKQLTSLSENYIINSNQSNINSSLKYRAKDRLTSGMKGDLQTYQMTNSTVLRMGQGLEHKISQSSNQGFKNSQLISAFNNSIVYENCYGDLTNSSSLSGVILRSTDNRDSFSNNELDKDQKEISQKQIYQEQQDESLDKSIQQGQKSEELQLLMTAFCTLYEEHGYLQGLVSQRSSLYQAALYKRQNRFKKFKQQLQYMRSVDEIRQIHTFYHDVIDKDLQNHKQIYEQVIGHLPLTIDKGKQLKVGKWKRQKQNKQNIAGQINRKQNQKQKKTRSKHLGYGVVLQ